jgi:hypothetical protein
VHAANGEGMEIDYVGHSFLHSPTSSLQLKNILHVPKASKNLISVNRLARDNNAYLEFHPNHFLLRNNRRRKSSTVADVKENFTLSSRTQISRGLELSSLLVHYGIIG